MSEIPEKIKEIYDVFIDFFGEKYIEHQNYNDDNRIVVHFPQVTVTNENNQKTIVYDLFALVYIYNSGHFKRLLFTRSTYTEEQFNANYLHSHVSPPHNKIDLEYGSHACTGTGPINHTIDTIRNSTDPSMWLLFCRELQQYVQVESLAGGPYVRISKIGNAGNLLHPIMDSFINTRHLDIPSIYQKFLNEIFIPYFLYTTDLNIIFNCGYHTLGYTNREWLELVTDKLKAFINKLIKDDSIAISHICVKKDTSGMYALVYKESPLQLWTRLYYNNGSYYNDKQQCTAPLVAFLDTSVINFKGTDYKLKILKTSEKEIEDNIYILPILASYIANQILYKLNSITI